MKIDLRRAGWSAALLAMTGLAYAIVREKRKAKARQELKGKVVLTVERLGFALVERYNQEQGV